jgi:hypothetical protein
MEISFNKFEITHCIPLLCLLTGAVYVESICFASCIGFYWVLRGISVSRSLVGMVFDRFVCLRGLLNTVTMQRFVVFHICPLSGVLGSIYLYIYIHVTRTAVSHLNQSHGPCWATARFVRLAGLAGLAGLADGDEETVGVQDGIRSR